MIKVYDYTETYRLDLLTCGELLPGTAVMHCWYVQSFGIVIAVLDAGVLVLWSRINDAFRPLDDELDRIRKAL